MSIAENIGQIKKTLPENVKLVAVSKFHSEAAILEAYEAGQRIFGENRVQELVPKYEHLPKDIEWHFIGHLQANKVKYIAPFVHTIQSVDSLRLLEEIDFQAKKQARIIPVLFQIHIAQETQKFGFFPDEIEDFFKKDGFEKFFPNTKISGLMGMATFTDDHEQIRREFKDLHTFFGQIKSTYFQTDENFKELSIGMSDDYPIAMETGSTIIRIGSRIFGTRK